MFQLPLLRWWRYKKTAYKWRRLTRVDFECDCWPDGASCRLGDGQSVLLQHDVCIYSLYEHGWQRHQGGAGHYTEYVVWRAGCVPQQYLLHSSHIHLVSCYTVVGDRNVGGSLRCPIWLQFCNTWLSVIRNGISKYHFLPYWMKEFSGSQSNKLEISWKNGVIYCRTGFDSEGLTVAKTATKIDHYGWNLL